MASLETGRLLAGRYLLQDRLGDGGHAEVWRARDEQSGRAVALKFLHVRGGGASDALPVLRHEAEMAQRLDHPGVLKPGTPQQDGSFAFLPMEYAAGGDASRLRGAAWRKLLPVLLQTARVLEHAHSRGVVHRDLKARNVLFDSLGNVRVSDFGAAAHTGSSNAPATGSPFSASPQQLRDEPATPADDIYGLGALAYELLTRYPPFYPDFDALRVQSEEPAAPVPAQPAPRELLSLVQSMLARDAAARPDIAAVIQQMEQLQVAGNTATSEAVTLVAEPASAANTAASARRSRATLAWSAGIAVTCIAGIALLVWLPDPRQPVAGSVPATPEAAVVRRVADAVVAGDTEVVEQVAETREPEVAPEQAQQSALQTGQSALDALQPEAARAAFERALQLQPGLPQAEQGVAAATRLQAQMSGMANGARLEAGGDLSGAADQYRLLLANDGSFKPARSALDRVEARLREQRLANLLDGAADSLRRGHIDEAQRAYERAGEMDPGNARVREGLLRIAEVQTSQLNAADMQAGARMEEGEHWDEAVSHYRQVLERDGALNFARDGLARSESRAALDRELRDYLARPERLTAASVQLAAERAVARGQASAGNSPRLRQQLEQLRARLMELAVPVPVAITSDNNTQVSLAPLGDLGQFDSREVRLPPGHYTLTGRRDGFRDVRYEFEITPGQSGAALSVKCTEQI